MAFEDDAVVLPGRGFLFWNDDVDAAPPAETPAAIAALNLEAATLTTGWRNIGNTSRENNMAFTKDGSEGDIKGSWQRPSLRKLPDETFWGINAAALQFTNDTMDLYYGEGDISDPDQYWVLPSATPMEGALWFCLVDGSLRVACMVPKVSATSDDVPEFAPDEFSEFSIKFSVLEEGTAKGLFGWFREGLGTPAP